MLHNALVIVVTKDDVVVEKVGDLGAVCTQVIGLLVLELGLDLLQILGKVRIVTLLLGRTFQQVKSHTRLRLVGHILVGHELDEILVVTIRYRECTVVDLHVGMAAHILVEEILDITQIVEYHGEGADILRLDLDVGHQALAVIYLAAVARAELADQRVGDDLGAAVGLVFRVVYLLHAAPRRDVILGRGEFQI